MAIGWQAIDASRALGVTGRTNGLISPTKGNGRAVAAVRRRMFRNFSRSGPPGPDRFLNVEGNRQPSASTGRGGRGRRPGPRHGHAGHGRRGLLGLDSRSQRRRDTEHGRHPGCHAERRALPRAGRAALRRRCRPRSSPPRSTSRRADLESQPVSPAGAEGLAQFMPATWPSLRTGRRRHRERDPVQPERRGHGHGPLRHLARQRHGIDRRSDERQPDRPHAGRLQRRARPRSSGPTACRRSPRPRRTWPRSRAEIPDVHAAGHRARRHRACHRGRRASGARWWPRQRSVLGRPYSWGGGTDQGPRVASPRGRAPSASTARAWSSTPSTKRRPARCSCPHSSEVQATMGDGRADGGHAARRRHRLRPQEQRGLRPHRHLRRRTTR